MNRSYTPEQRLAVLLCSTQERRLKREDEAVALVERAHGDRLLALLERLKVAPLADSACWPTCGCRPVGRQSDRVPDG